MQHSSFAERYIVTVFRLLNSFKNYFE